MGYSGVFVFGDSLVDAGNALELSEFVDDLPLQSLPDGAPTAELGYYDGRFTNGLTFADLISNKFISVPTTTVFPFGFEDPWLGLSFPFVSDPNGNNLNFAYGGAQIRKGSESVPDIDDQTDAYRDAVDGDADPNALHLITIGGNDVRSLVPVNGTIASATTALSRLANAAEEMYEEVRQLIDIGARHIMVTGIPNVGIIPAYNGLADEAARRAAATEYSALLDGMIEDYMATLQATHPSVELHYVSFVDATASIVENLEDYYGPIGPLNESELIFFDAVHPTAQAHALLAASFLDSMNGSPAGEAIPLASPIYALGGTIALTGEADKVIISLAANTSYTFEMLGLSSGSGSLADPSLRITTAGGAVVAVNDDAGLGLDAVVQFSTAQAGDHTIEMTGVGSLTGSYTVHAAGASTGDNTYMVSNSAALVLERQGEGYDTVLASVSYTLAAGASVERLATANERGTTAIVLTGNELDQSIIGNAGNNRLDGKGGSDSLWGKAGKDTFAFTSAPSNGQIDTIWDFNVRDDTIALDDAVFIGLPIGTLAKGAFATGPSAKDTSDRIIFDPSNGHLYFDPDGIGAIAQTQFATLIGTSLKLTASDFVVI